MNLKESLLEVIPHIFDQELDFFPLYLGLKPSSMGLKKMDKYNLSKKEEDKIFLFGPSFLTFRKSKEICRRDSLEKYYQSQQEYPEIIKFIVEVLSEQNADLFEVEKSEKQIKIKCFLTKDEFTLNSKYELVDQKTSLNIPFVDAFDALAMNVPEDLVIHHVPQGQLNPFKKESDKKDFAAKIHLTHCNGWDAKWAIGQTFNFIHKGVPRIEKIIPNAIRMLMSFFNKDIIYERVAAISFKTNGILNRHEEYESLWKTPFNEQSPQMQIRVERQTVTGFPQSEAFLFTIRTFLYDVNSFASGLPLEIQKKRHKAILDVFNNPDPKSYAYKIIMTHKENVLKWMETLHGS